MRKQEQILEEIRDRLEPPTEEELNNALAKRMFGNNADKMLKYSPWSFLLTKIMWKEGEEPWTD